MEALHAYDRIWKKIILARETWFVDLIRIEIEKKKCYKIKSDKSRYFILGPRSVHKNTNKLI